MAQWHASFPQRPRTQSIRTWVDAPVRVFEPDQGPQIARVAGSAEYDCWSGVYGFTLEQLRLFRSFFKTTINRGVDSFTMLDPISGVTATVEFFDKAARPEFREVINDYYEAELAFRVIS